MAGEAFEYEDDVKVEDVPSAKDLKDEEKPKNEEKAGKDEEAPKGDESDDSSENEFTDSEQLAYSQGWRPQDEWKGDPEKWVSANEFLFRGELMDRIQKQTKVINDMKSGQEDLKKALQVLGEHNKQIAEKEYNRALASLKKQRREAMREDDFETVDEIEDRMDELKDAKREAAEAPESDNKDTDTDTKDEQQAVPQEVVDWMEKNSTWYDKDTILRGAADGVFLSHLNTNPGDFKGALESVDEAMRQRFPEEFGMKKKATGSAVTEGSGRAKGSQKSGKSTKFTVKDLNDEQRNIAKTFVDSGAFKNAQEYVDQLAELGELDAQQ